MKRFHSNGFVFSWPKGDICAAFRGANGRRRKAEHFWKPINSIQFLLTKHASVVFMVEDSTSS